ncbi:MAG: helix-turn-helix domain-containing protein [Gordonia sp. (in: high G+C Gram-positive bacteria)]
MRTHGWGGCVPATDDEAIGRILAATREVIDERGAATTLADVARLLGVTRQTVYRYFPSTEALLAATALDATEEFMAGIATRLVGVGEPDVAVIMGVTAVLDTLADDRYMGILLQPGHQSIGAIGQFTSAGARAFARSMVDRMDVDWMGCGYADDDIDLVVEIILRTLQSMIIDPGGDRLSVTDRALLLDRWLGAAVRGLVAGRKVL